MTRFALLLVLLSGAVARADGFIDVRGAYYKERSTRVEQPMIDGAFDTGANGRITAHLLIDAITSASAATGTGGGEFTEKRYEGGADYTYAISPTIKLGGEVRRSTESDYFSTYVAAHGEFALFDQDLVIRLLVGHSFDNITNGVQVATGAIGTPARAETLDTTFSSVTVTQVFTPRLLAHLTYDFSLLDGYQANIYRVVRGGAQPAPERVPDLRFRHAVAVGWRWFLPTKTTFVLDYRLYWDDWGIVAHTPEIRLIQSFLGGLIDLRARYRYYTQNAADFYKDVYSAADVMDPSVFLTADPKLSGFTTQTVGGQLSLALAALGWHGRLSDARFDVTVEHIWQTNTFGDAWVGEVGLSVPFAY